MLSPIRGLTSPFRGFLDWQSEMDRMMADAFGRMPQAPAIGAGWAPAVDVIARDSDMVIKAELPGMKREDVDVSFANAVVTLDNATRSRRFVAIDEAKAILDQLPDPLPLLITRRLYTLIDVRRRRAGSTDCRGLWLHRGGADRAPRSRRRSSAACCRRRCRRRPASPSRRTTRRRAR